MSATMSAGDPRCVRCGGYHWLGNCGCLATPLTYGPDPGVYSMPIVVTPPGARLVDNGDGSFALTANVRVRPEDLSEAAAMLAKLRELHARATA